jgi:hypothetical protein
MDSRTGRCYSFSLTQAFVDFVKASEALHIYPRLLVVLAALADVVLFSYPFSTHFLSKIYLPVLFHLCFLRRHLPYVSTNSMLRN